MRKILLLHLHTMQFVLFSLHSVAPMSLSELLPLEESCTGPFGSNFSFPVCPYRHHRITCSRSHCVRHCRCWKPANSFLWYVYRYVESNIFLYIIWNFAVICEATKLSIGIPIKFSGYTVCTYITAMYVQQNMVNIQNTCTYTHNYKACHPIISQTPLLQTVPACLQHLCFIVTTNWKVIYIICISCEYHFI